MCVCVCVCEHCVGKLGAVCVCTASRSLTLCRDTLFTEDFSLSDFIQFFSSSPCREGGGALAPCYKCRDEGTYKPSSVST